MQNRPCVTTYANGFKVSTNPLVYVIDSPGLLVPNIHDMN